VSDLSDIAGGDPRRAERLRQSLAHLAASDNELLREMARAVLDGDLGLREAAASQVYGKALAGSFSTFWSEYQELTPEEQTALRERGESA